MTAWELSALGAIGWACVGLGLTLSRAWRRGTSTAAATPVGSPWVGIGYAFGPGMRPGAKESASQHPWVYAAGMLYHGGVAAAAATFAVLLGGLPMARAAARGLVVVLLAALVAGVALAVRRAGTSVLRAISAPDDYAANLLVDIWLATAALSLLRPTAAPAFLAATTAVAVYAPLGKLRHGLFFWLSRARFGARLGRRGVVRSRPTGGRA